jgi:L-alanine-DL-glutamate epimerase-like enolase superfamily enzyme
MQITSCEVTPVEMKLRLPVRMAGNQEINRVTAVFLRIETRDGRNAWGCCVAHPELTGEQPENAIHACQKGAQMAPDLHPLNLEYSLAKLSPSLNASPGARCAFDLAFYDLLSLAADLPLYRLLGGYRHRIQTSVTIPIASLEDSVEIARRRARQGFRMLKIKGGVDPEADVARVQAIHRALPDHTIRLDADGGYSIRQALEVARALQTHLEMLEQPTPADDLEALRQVTKSSPVPVLADQSARGPESILQIAAQHCASGISIKAAACGGLHCARQADAIARAAQMSVMISCVLEPALLIAAGLSLALSSPNVHFCDLDGNLDFASDPTLPGFRLEDGWLTAGDVPGLGCSVNLS